MSPEDMLNAIRNIIIFLDGAGVNMEGQPLIKLADVITVIDDKIAESQRI